jgi:hypothetical protein
MSKQKRKSQPTQQTKPMYPPVAASPAKVNRADGGRSPSWVWAVVALGVLVLIGGGAWLISRSANTPSAPVSAASAAPVGMIGGVTACRQQPKFTLAIGFSRSALLSTADRTVKGMILYEPQPDGPPRSYQHPSWSSAGYLGPNAIDKDGNIYLAPAPRVNLIDNPPAVQNKIYKVDTNTGEMAEFINLPAVRSPSLTNPYGVLGLAYDCDTHSLYATTVAGSSRREAVGRIYRIDLNTGKVASQLNDLDAIGLVVFNGAQGKRLYFGSARTQDVLSAPLDGEGNFSGQPRVEFSLEGLGPEGNDKVRKITIERGNDMVINGTKFTYNLAPPAAQLRPMTYRYRYDPATDLWSFVDAVANPLTAQ